MRRGAEAGWDQYASEAGNSAASVQAHEPATARNRYVLSYRHTHTHTRARATYFMSLLFSCKLTSLDGNKQVGRRPCQLGNSTVSVVCSGTV